MKHRLFCALLIFCLAASVIPTGAQGAEYAAEEIYFESESLGASDTDEVFDAYVERTLYPDRAVSAFGASAGERLSGVDKKIYGRLKEHVTAVANGENASGTVRIDASVVEELGLKTTWTSEELGVPYIADTKDVAEIFWKQIDISAVQSSLLADCPYEMYWFDKTEGLLWGNSVSYSKYNGTQQIASVTIKGLTFVFAVLESYQADGYDESAPMLDTQRTGAAAATRANAQAIVNRYASASDYEKLVAYRDEICALVSYDEAAAGGSVSYGDPWQIIYVFDGNARTNVVCEGYSKAFQYLCDLSDFDGSTVCYTVTGQLDGGAHMWNVVAMDDGGHYSVDVTNSDTGMIGDDGSLVLAGAEGSVTQGYAFRTGNDYTVFAYDDDTLSLWESDTDVLGIRSVSYSSVYSPITVSLPDTLVYDGEEISAGEANEDIVYSCELDGYTLSHAFFKTDGKTAAAPKGAGEYVITVTASRSGLQSFVTSKRVIIKKAELTVTPSAVRISRGQTPPDTVECSFEGFVGDDTSADLGGTVKIIHEYAKDGDVGEYRFNVSGYTSDNYNITYKAGTLTVTAAQGEQQTTEDTEDTDTHKEGSDTAETAAGATNGADTDASAAERRNVELAAAATVAVAFAVIASVTAIIVVACVIKRRKNK